jgi:hypothetical protein
MRGEANITGSAAIEEAGADRLRREARRGAALETSAVDARADKGASPFAPHFFFPSAPNCSR